MPIRIEDIGPPTTIAAGASVREEYFWRDSSGNGIDRGVCFASIATEPQFFGELTQNKQGRIGSTSFIGGVWYPGGKSWTYTVTTTNRSDRTVAFNLRIAILNGG